MENFEIYKDIATRTNGDIYIGVVGPVRCGKSTFITKFMENIVVPNIENKHAKQRTIDELPQAGEGILKAHESVIVVNDTKKLLKLK